MQNMHLSGEPVFPWQTIIEFFFCSLEFMWSVAGQGGKLELQMPAVFSGD